MEDADYITIHFMGHTWMPVRISTKPHGWEHVVDTKPSDEDRLVAKRAAVSWAKSLGLVYKVPVQ